VSEIKIESAGEGSGETRFRVTIREGDSTSDHLVTVTDGDYRRLGEGFDSYQDFVRATFEFLLGREPKESILSEFDVSVIPQYFPEYEKEMTGRGT
jgi:hypothetical protein